MKKSNLDIIKLVKITCKNFKNQKIDPKIYPKLSLCNDNVWKKITEEFFGEFSYKKALVIFQRFQRNTDGYAKMVENQMKSNKLSVSFGENLESIYIEFDKKEFEAFKISGNERKRLLVDFEQSLNDMLQRKGFNCYFGCNYNWFKNQTLLDNFENVKWNGLYQCIYPKCTNFIKPCLFEQSEQKVLIRVFFSNEIKHTRIEKNIRITGNERKLLSHSLKAEGVTNIFNKYNFENCIEKKKNLIRLNTLQKIKNELDNQFRLSRDLIFDLRATKVLCGNLGLSTNADFKGYVHNICLDPYGFLMMSDIQIQIWNRVKEKNPVWYFDATGSIHKDIFMQKKPLLYSMVLHDRKNKQIIPVAEFITTDQSTKSISSFLHHINYNFQENRKQKDFSIAPIIVMDFSWALINGVLNVFNKMSIREYLDWSFRKIINNKEDKIEILPTNTRVYLCSTHFLKSLVKKTKKIDLEPNIRTFFIFCFTLLQNSVSIIQFNNYLLNIKNIFDNNQKTSALYYSLATIRIEIQNRNLDKLDFSSFENETCSVNKSNECKKNIADSSLETIESIKKTSPFSSYFDNILKSFHEKITTKKIKSHGENVFYHPQLFALIVDQLYLLPLWTGLAIDDFKKNYKSDLSECFKTRLTNNPVENYFGLLKNRVLGKRKVFPSDFVSLNFLRIKSKFFQYYMEKSSTNDEDTKNSILNFKEKWTDKKKKRNAKKQFCYEIEPIKEKGFYFQNRDVFDLIYNDLFEFDPNVIEISSRPYQNLSLFIDDFVNLTNDGLPMEIDTTNRSISDIKTFEDRIDFDEFKIIYEAIIDENIQIENLKTYFIKQKIKIGNLVNFLRLKKLSVLYNVQLVETFRPFNIIIDLNELNNFVPIKTKGDGNCFYRSVSYVIFGTDEYFYLFKIGSLFILLEYKELFEDIIEKHFYTKPFDQIFFKSTRKNEWAMSLNILATSILLNRAIYSYGLNNETLVPFCQKYLFSNTDSEPIRLGFFVNHFIPFLNKSSHQFESVENAFDLFVNYREYFKIKHYE